MRKKEIESYAYAAKVMGREFVLTPIVHHMHETPLTWSVFGALLWSLQTLSSFLPSSNTTKSITFELSPCFS
jgi:hypothetical protein